jgi:hypothetical protein
VTEGQVSNRLFVSHIPTADDLVSQQQAPQQVQTTTKRLVPTSTGTADPHPNLVYVFRTLVVFSRSFHLSLVVVIVIVIVAFLFPYRSSSFVVRLVLVDK